MVDLMDLQKQVYDNKVAHGFNTENVEMEFCLIMGELGEAYHAYAVETKAAFAEELADVALYLLGLCEITGVDIETEMLKKLEKNKRRKYRPLDNGHMVKID